MLFKKLLGKTIPEINQPGAVSNFEVLPIIGRLNDLGGFSVGYDYDTTGVGYKMLFYLIPKVKGVYTITFFSSVAGQSAPDLTNILNLGYAPNGKLYLPEDLGSVATANNQNTHYYLFKDNCFYNGDDTAKSEGYYTFVVK